jgi:hypothetical protein
MSVITSRLRVVENMTGAQPTTVGLMYVWLMTNMYHPESWNSNGYPMDQSSAVVLPVSISEWVIQTHPQRPLLPSGIEPLLVGSSVPVQGKTLTWSQR